MLESKGLRSRSCFGRIVIGSCELSSIRKEVI